MFLNKRKVYAGVFLVFVVLMFLNLDTANGMQISHEESNFLEEEYKDSGISKISEHLMNNYAKELNQIFPVYDPQNIIKEAMSGKIKFDIPGIINGTILYIFKEVCSNLRILLKLVILVILCSILKNLRASFLSENVAQLAFFVCYIVIVSILIISFDTAINLGKHVIENMVYFMYMTVPVLTTILLSGGNITSAGLLQPLLLAIIQISSTMIKSVFLPMTFFSAILSIINNISEKVHLSKLATFLRQLSSWGLGFVLTIFIAIISVQGTLGTVVDGVTSKTAKFAISTFVPVVGKYLSDAADTVIGCSLIIKNATGLVVMLGIVAICIVPLLKILSMVILYRLVCVVIEPISENRIINCINDIANSMTFVLGLTASVALMFFVSVTAVISASNMSKMLG